MSDHDDTEKRHGHEDDGTTHAGSTEAGIVRGVSRSVAQRAVAARSAGRSLVKLPNVGKLPRARPRLAATKTRVPVRQVAKLTDRMSTGLDVWESASSGNADALGSQQSKQQQAKSVIKQSLARVQAIAGSLLKNTVLGAIVFETYCELISYADGILSRASTTASHKHDNNNHESNHDHYKDVFETTPLPVHFFAGAAAGSMQGVGGMIWDNTYLSISARMIVPPNLSVLTSSVAQHSAAHSILFGSYESYKRLFLWAWKMFDPEMNQEKQQSILSLSSSSSSLLLPHQRLEYLSGIAVAGGLAGQSQHIVSHILERPPGERLAGGFRHVLPSLRSTLWAFPPSAIAFLAFEYGKDKVVELSENEEPGDGDDIGL